VGGGITGGSRCKQSRVTRKWIAACVKYNPKHKTEQLLVQSREPRDEQRGEEGLVVLLCYIGRSDVNATNPHGEWGEKGKDGKAEIGG
jgi:hypothetical protein